MGASKIYRERCYIMPNDAPQNDNEAAQNLETRAGLGMRRLSVAPMLDWTDK